LRHFWQAIASHDRCTLRHYLAARHAASHSFSQLQVTYHTDWFLWLHKTVTTSFSRVKPNILCLWACSVHLSSHNRNGVSNSLWRGQRWVTGPPVEAWGLSMPECLPASCHFHSSKQPNGALAQSSPPDTAPWCRAIYIIISPQPIDYGWSHYIILPLLSYAYLRQIAAVLCLLHCIYAIREWHYMNIVTHAALWQLHITISHYILSIYSWLIFSLAIDIAYAFIYWCHSWLRHLIAITPHFRHQSADNAPGMGRSHTKGRPTASQGLHSLHCQAWGLPIIGLTASHNRTIISLSPVEWAV